MPRVPPTFDPVKYMIAEREKFSAIAYWQRSKRGNLWRLWEGRTVTVFVRTDEFYGWSIADDNGPRFSRGGYETEDEAMDALAEALWVGE
jgi:hypothetical protein